MSKGKIPFFTSLTTVGSREAAAFESPLHRLLEQNAVGDPRQGRHQPALTGKQFPTPPGWKATPSPKFIQKSPWESLSNKKLRARAHELTLSNAEFAEASKRVMVAYSTRSVADQKDFEAFCSESLSKWKSTLEHCDIMVQTLRDRNLAVPARLTVGRVEEQKSRAARFQASWDELQSSRDKTVDMRTSSNSG